MRIVFHVPYPLNPDSTAASGIRPLRMKEAFEALGHEVWVVQGHSTERRRNIGAIDRAAEDGITFDLVYSESSTMPTALTDPHHLPLRPLMDFAFLRRMRKRGTKVGLFYRDMHWRFDFYGQGLNPIKKQVALANYRYDLLAYRHVVDVLYLPSMLMEPYVRVPVTTKALAPGHELYEGPTPGPATGAHLVYIGGLGPNYKMQLLLEAVQVAHRAGADVSLDFCTPENLWQQAGEDYHRLAGGPVRIVHQRGAGLKSLYERANLGALFNEPSEYRNFAAPVKLYEYLGHAKPMIASAGTLAGEYVSADGIGWTISYELQAAVDLLTDLAAHPEKIVAKRDVILKLRDQHSWRQRAQQVIDDLSAQTRAGG